MKNEQGLKKKTDSPDRSASALQPMQAERLLACTDRSKGFSGGGGRLEEIWNPRGPVHLLGV